jgi:ribonuclease-3
VAAGNGAPAGGGIERDRSKLLAALEVPVTHDLLERALTHRSYAYENGGLPTNERLEFLGDAVLQLIVTDTLYCKHPDHPEGQLAKLRAAVVQMRALAGVARDLRLGTYVRLGRGEEGTGGRDKPSILADTLEAVIGAVYLDCGLEAACRLVHRLFDPVIANSARLGAALDWKTSLQELTAAELLGVPEYRVEESGPDHQKLFRATVRVAGRTYGSGQGRSKKEAEQQAAEAAYNAIRNGLESEAARVRDPKDPAAAPAVPPQDAAGVPPQDAAGVPPQDGKAVPPQVGKEAPHQDGKAASAQDGKAAPSQEGPAVPSQNGKAAPPGDGRAVPPQAGKAAPPQDGPAVPPQDDAAPRRPPRDSHQD